MQGESAAPWKSPVGTRQGVQMCWDTAGVPRLWGEDSAPFGELEAAPGTPPLCGHPPPRAAGTGRRGRATALPGEGVGVPAVEHSPPPHPGTAEGPEAWGDTRPSSAWPSCACPAQPSLCGFTGAVASPAASLPPDRLSHVCPLLPGPSRSPCTQNRAAQGSRDAQHWLGGGGGVGAGMAITPVPHNPGVQRSWQTSLPASQSRCRAGTVMLSAPGDLGGAGPIWVWSSDGVRLSRSL